LDPDLKITLKEDHLLIEFTGRFTIDSANRSVDVLMKKCEETSCTRVLFDIRSMTGDMSTIDRYKVGQYGCDTIDRTIRIAMLGRKDQVSPDKFFENFTVNRGLSLKVFTVQEEAVAWLKE